MSKPEIFTTAIVVDKENIVRYGEDLSRFITEQFGRRLAEKIYQECQKGERIVSVGEPYSQDILKKNLVETKMDVRVQELVRCKDCCYWNGTLCTENALCSVDNVYAVTPRDGFCYKGRKSE